MIGVDTNVLVRYLTQDDAMQARKASDFIEALTPEAPGFVPQVVIVELVWVLDSCYQATRAEIVIAVETLLRTKELVVENAALLWKTVRAYGSTSADFSDLLIAICAHQAGCAETATFDRGAAKHAGMRLLE